jgi:CBS domain-containing protein
MPTTDVAAAGGYNDAPPYELAYVRDAMRYGVITCPPETPLPIVARMMVSQHVHAVVVTPAVAERDVDSAELAWGIVSDRELMHAGSRAADMTAAGAASTVFVKAGADEPLDEVVDHMIAAGSTHAVVVTPSAGHPLGVLSSLDVAAVIGWGHRR